MDDGASTIESEGISVALSMWRMFHNTITVLFRNLDSAENNLRGFANMILASKELEDIFRPRYDSTVSFEANMLIESKYQAFSTWLLGRLFYIVSCSQFERIHHLFMQTQTKVLSVLQLNQPHVHLRLVHEYNAVLADLNRMKDGGQATAVLRRFVPECSLGDLELAPIEVCVPHVDLDVLRLKVVQLLTTAVADDLLAACTPGCAPSPLDSLLRCLCIGPDALCPPVVVCVARQLRPGRARPLPPELDLLVRVAVQHAALALQHGTAKCAVPLWDALHQLLGAARRARLHEAGGALAAELRHACDAVIACTPEAAADSAAGALDAAVQLWSEAVRNSRRPCERAALLGAAVARRRDARTLRPLLVAQIVQEALEAARHGPTQSADLCVASTTWAALHDAADASDLCWLQDLLAVAADARAELAADGAHPSRCLDATRWLALVAGSPALVHLAAVADALPDDDERSLANQLLRAARDGRAHPDSRAGAVRALVLRACRLTGAARRHVLGLLGSLLPVAGGDPFLAAQLADNCAALLCAGWERAGYVRDILLPLLASGDELVLRSATARLGDALCALAGAPLAEPDPQHAPLPVRCAQCQAATTVARGELADSATADCERLLCRALELLAHGDVAVRRNVVGALPALSRHVRTFHEPRHAGRWLGTAALDADEGVRAQLARVLGAVLRAAPAPQAAAGAQAAADELMGACRQAAHDADAVHVTLAAALEAAGRAAGADSDAVFVVLRQLLLLVLAGGAGAAPRAVRALEAVATAHGTSPCALYARYKKNLCDCIVRGLVHRQLTAPATLSDLLDLVALALGLGTREWLARDCHHLLPFLVPYLVDNAAAAGLLAALADVMMLEPAELLATNFAGIFAHLYLSEGARRFRQCMQLVERVTGTSVAVLQRRNVKMIHNELLLRYHELPELVVSALSQVARVCAAADGGGEPTPGAADPALDLGAYLQPRFLGVLVYLDSKLVSRSVADYVKKCVLRSLPELVRVMGAARITPLRFKVLAMLRTALQLRRAPFPELSVAAWDAFVRCCDVESLGPLLSTVFVSLLPLSEQFGRRLAPLFRYLLVENGEQLRDHIPDLFFAADEPRLPADLRALVRRHEEAAQPQTFAERLTRHLRHVQHENADVRLRALHHLGRLLRGGRDHLHRLVLHSAGMDASVVLLADVLTAGCRDADAALRLAAADCLGELGAIEPSLFPRRHAPPGTAAFTFRLADDGFVAGALLELVRALQSERHTQNMDRFALAIQELLKGYGVSPAEDAPRRHLWAGFPEHAQQLMLPLLSSRYTVASHADRTAPRHPLYGSPLAASFRDWVYNWTCHLISLVPEEQRALLQVCKPSLKQDLRTLSYFLPHVLVEAVIHGGEQDRQLVLQELQAVLNASTASPRAQLGEDVRPLRTRAAASDASSAAATAAPAQASDTSQYANTAFGLVDHVFRWLREWRYANCPRIPDPLTDTHFAALHAFSLQLCPLQVARSTYACGEHRRALMYLEQYIGGDRGRLHEQLAFLVRVYAELGEPDAVAGAMALLQAEPSVEDLVLAHRAAGQLQDAAACYERMAQEAPTAQCVRDLVQCYLDLDCPMAAIGAAAGAMDRFPEWRPALQESQAEPYWRLGMHDRLRQLLEWPEMQHSGAWGVRVGQALVHFRDGRVRPFADELANMRRLLTDRLNAAGPQEGAYSRGYAHVARLHVLSELQHVHQLVSETLLPGGWDVEAAANAEEADFDVEACERALRELVRGWDLRLRVVQAAARTLEPVLCVRRIALQQAHEVLRVRAPRRATPLCAALDRHVARYWLRSAQVARRGGALQQAHNCLLQAERYRPAELFVERAELLWAREEHELAFSTLRRGLTDESLARDARGRRLCARARLLVAAYNESTANVDRDVNMQHYKDAVDADRSWERSWVRLAQYYDRVLHALPEAQRDVLPGGDLQLHVVNCFGKSLQFGSEFLYQSMPRLLSVWLDYGTRLMDARLADDAAAADAKRQVVCKMIRLVDSYLDRLPTYTFLSAFPQLVSRVCHPMREVYLQLKSVLVKVIARYPHHSMWLLLAVAKSGYAVRCKRCQEVLQDPRLKSTGAARLVYDYNALAERLIELCNKPVADGITTARVGQLVRALPRLLRSRDFSQIMLPTQRQRKLTLPPAADDDYDNCGEGDTAAPAEHDPFPERLVYIADVADEMRILQSLQKPRKITFLGSDGRRYVHMLKARDDLRKDSRLMDFNDVVNLYLRREAESRQRRLYIRTYSVVALNEGCGMIEWLDNLIGLRPILMGLYRGRGQHVGARELKSLVCGLREPLARKRQVFVEQLVPRHPPVLSHWFRLAFPDAHSWYEARAAYTRTAAAISMVGYVLGLGDRHGENILLDATNGDTVHVDFDCLFNKGETFDWPERVPFRLTHNMVDAFGPLGVDAGFRRACAATLRVLRTHADTLVSTVRPFVYDPLLSWPRTGRAPPAADVGASAATAERTNEQAVEHVRNIELRLRGTVRSRAGKALSISLSAEGQADLLIQEATDIDNLCQMYVGWGPYL